MNNIIPVINGKVENRQILMYTLPNYMLEIRNLIDGNIDTKNIILNDIIRSCFKDISLIDVILKYKEYFILKNESNISTLLINIKILCNDIKLMIKTFNINEILAIDIEANILKIIYIKG